MKIDSTVKKLKFDFIDNKTSSYETKTAEAKTLLIVRDSLHDIEFFFAPRHSRNAIEILAPRTVIDTFVKVVQKNVVKDGHTRQSESHKCVFSVAIPFAEIDLGHKC